MKLILGFPETDVLSNYRNHTIILQKQIANAERKTSAFAPQPQVFLKSYSPNGSTALTVVI